LIAGTLGGTAATGLLYPLELIKTRMQVIDDSSGVYRSLRKAFTTVLRKEGVEGLYSGVGPAVFAAAGSWGGYFYFYEQSKERKKQYLPMGAQLQTTDHVSLSVLLCIYATALHLLPYASHLHPPPPSPPPHSSPPA
jgi:hypothetical protein